MEIRKIRPEEKILETMLCNIVYVWQESEGFRAKLENPLEHSEGYEKVWAGFDGAGKMCAVTTVNNHQVRFNGHTAHMGGVGAVGTLPEARKGGYIRRIFERILPVMLEEGKVFSYLYPFSYQFYRKFGYELCYTPNRITVPMTFFGEYPFPDGMDQYFPGTDISELMSVYNEFIKDKNLPLVRDEAFFRRRADKDPYSTRHYAYLHRDKSGKADAYLLFQSVGGIEDRELKVRELIWNSPQALHAMFGFIAQLGAEFTTLTWDAPSSVNLPSLFSAGFDYKVETPPHGMNRILNLKRAFEMMPAPKTPGRVTIGVTDDALPVNSGTYTVEWDGTVTLKPSSGACDMETDIQTLTQLVTGFLSVDQVRLKRSAVINGGAESLRELFVRRDLYIADYF
jgi:predicted acetyltransferase